MKRNAWPIVVAVLLLALCLVGSIEGSPAGENVVEAAGTGHISIPAAAFQPAVDGYDYNNTGFYLANLNGSSTSYVAAVYLPHGATVTKVTFYYDDGSPSNYAYASLDRTNLYGMADTMASILSDDGKGSKSDFSIDYAVVDNTGYAYYAVMTLWDSNLQGFGLIIEYSYTTHLPLAVRNTH